ncbi:MAG: DUF1579 domain-containing protein [Planctomycetes bacterium]|nr:DUF1579 domain-containing protein [Planctomycetota bacterium]
MIGRIAFSFCLCAMATLLGCRASPKEATGAEKAAAEPVKDPEALMKFWAQHAAPGEHHKHLDPLVGSWDTEVKWWTSPAAEPQVSRGKAEVKWILGGRFLEEEVQGGTPEQPFQGLGLQGYDNFLKKHQSFWIDSMSTSLMISSGTCDGAGKVFTLSGTYLDPAAGKEKASRGVLSITSGDSHVYEMYESGPDGEEYRSLQVMYTRRK